MSQQFTEKDEQIAESILCKICKNQFQNPIQLPCSEHICHSHLNEFIKVNKTNNRQRYFDCCLCQQQHSIAAQGDVIDQLFDPSQISLSFVCSLFENDSYSKLFSECKQLLEKLKHYDHNNKSTQTNHEKDLIDYFSDLRSKINLRREVLFLEIRNTCDELLVELNQIEKDYLNQLKRIYHADFELKELNAKVKKYEKDLNKYKIDLNEWQRINDMLKRDVSQLEQIKKNSTKLVLSKDKIKFKIDYSLDTDFKNLFGKIKSNLFLNGRLIISAGSEDCSIKIWDLNSGECVKTIQDAHTDYVLCLELLDYGNLVSGSWDKTIKIWDLKIFECVRTLYGHTDGVCCLKKINENELMSGSGDSTIKIWNLNTGKCLRTLHGHRSHVKCLEITSINDPNKLIISCSNDKTIKVWSYENGESLRTLIGHTNSVICLNLMNGSNGQNKIISGSADRKIKIWNINTGECLKTLIAHNHWVNCIKSFKENQFVSGSGDGYIKQWDIENGICLNTIKAHDDYIWALEVSEDGRVFSGSGDKSIKVWNMESGESIKTLTGHSDEVRSLILISNSQK